MTTSQLLRHIIILIIKTMIMGISIAGLAYFVKLMILTTTQAIIITAIIFTAVNLLINIDNL